jgi:transcriptional regulator with XRE-family HTH domain
MNSKMPRAAIRAEFACQLQKRLNEKDWTQAELARRSGVGRDNISEYLRARVLPRPEALEALPKALECEPGDLVPSRGTASDEQSQVTVRDIGGGKVWLHIDGPLTWPIALEVMGVLGPKR